MAPSKVCALAFDCLAAICKFRCARSQSSGTPRPYRYFSPSATRRSSKVAAGAVGGGLGITVFRAGAAATAGASFAAGSDVGGSLVCAAAAAGAFAGASPESGPLFASVGEAWAVTFGAADGLEEAEVPSGEGSAAGG